MRRFRQALTSSPIAFLVLGVVQLALWILLAGLAADFTPSNDFSQRPMLWVVLLLVTNFVFYLASLALVWNAKTGRDWQRHLPMLVVAFAILFRLPMWWSQPIQEIDIYRYLWDGRVVQSGINPYRYSPAQVDAALESQASTPELARLVTTLRRSAPIQEIFERIGHRNVATIYPPLSQAVFAMAAWLTPETATVIVQVRVLKGILLAFDLAILGFVMGLLRQLGQPVACAMAYGWCPLILKEFANSGHLDSIAVCLTVVTLWLLVIRQQINRNPHESESNNAQSRPSRKVLRHDWLAAVTWACSILAKLYPLVLGPVLLAFWWHRLRWKVLFPVALFGALLLAGYAVLPRNSPTDSKSIFEADPEVTTATEQVARHSSFSGLGEFLRRWEMNDLLFSIVYENLRPPSSEPKSRAQPWYVFVPAGAREVVHRGLEAVAQSVNPKLLHLNLPFLFTQSLMAAIVLTLAAALALRRWPEDGRQELLRRTFLCLAWLWYLSATQNPWYWSWALPFALFASRTWRLVSGFALLYYLRFWFIDRFPESTLVGGLNGQRLFDEVIVWIEHLPVLLLLAVQSFRKE